MLSALRLFHEYSSRGGMFINSCFAHCQSESQDTWFAPDSPTIDNKVLFISFITHFQHFYVIFLTFNYLLGPLISKIKFKSIIIYLNQN